MASPSFSWRGEAYTVDARRLRRPEITTARGEINGQPYTRRVYRVPGVVNSRGKVPVWDTEQTAGRIYNRAQQAITEYRAQANAIVSSIASAPSSPDPVRVDRRSAKAIKGRKAAVAKLRAAAEGTGLGRKVAEAMAARGVGFRVPGTFGTRKITAEQIASLDDEQVDTLVGATLAEPPPEAEDLAAEVMPADDTDTDDDPSAIVDLILSTPGGIDVAIAVLEYLAD